MEPRGGASVAALRRCQTAHFDGEASQTVIKARLKSRMLHRCVLSYYRAEDDLLLQLKRPRRHLLEIVVGMNIFSAPALPPQDLQASKANDHIYTAAIFGYQASPYPYLLFCPRKVVYPVRVSAAQECQPSATPSPFGQSFLSKVPPLNQPPLSLYPCL